MSSTGRLSASSVLMLYPVWVLLVLILSRAATISTSWIVVGFSLILKSTVAVPPGRHDHAREPTGLRSRPWLPAPCRFPGEIARS